MVKYNVLCLCPFIAGYDEQSLVRQRPTECDRHSKNTPSADSE